MNHPAPGRAPSRGVYFLLFTVSGFAGLIYESIWSHYLKLFLGHAAYAQTLVLAIFMGGMAHRLLARAAAVARAGATCCCGYALAEAVIGVRRPASSIRLFVAATDCGLRHAAARRSAPPAAAHGRQVGAGRPR